VTFTVTMKSSVSLRSVQLLIDIYATTHGHSQRIGHQVLRGLNVPKARRTLVHLAVRLPTHIKSGVYAVTVALADRSGKRVYNRVRLKLRLSAPSS
jgi:hypothetical protein